MTSWFHFLFSLDVPSRRSVKAAPSFWSVLAELSSSWWCCQTSFTVWTAANLSDRLATFHSPRTQVLQRALWGRHIILVMRNVFVELRVPAEPLPLPLCVHQPLFHVSLSLFFLSVFHTHSLRALHAANPSLSSVMSAVGATQDCRFFFFFLATFFVQNFSFAV